MNTMIAYCGLDYEKCDSYLATIRNDPALRENPKDRCYLCKKALFTEAAHALSPFSSSVKNQLLSIIVELLN